MTHQLHLVDLGVVRLLGWFRPEWRAPSIIVGLARSNIRRLAAKLPISKSKDRRSDLGDLSLLQLAVRDLVDPTSDIKPATLPV